MEYSFSGVWTELSLHSTEVPLSAERQICHIINQGLCRLYDGIRLGKIFRSSPAGVGAADLPAKPPVKDFALSSYGAHQRKARLNGGRGGCWWGWGHVKLILVSRPLVIRCLAQIRSDS